MDQVIEKNIWQTFRDDIDKVPEYIGYTIDSWRSKNLNWNYNYLNDQDLDDFIYEEFGSEWSNLINKKCIIPVMKADVWRIMCLYKYGGIYADIDTLCTDSLDNWMPRYNNKDFICGYENDNQIGQWCIISKSEHPALEKILQNIHKNLISGDAKKDSIYELTGSIVVTKSILENVHISKNKTLLVQNRSINNSEYFIENKMHLLSDESFLVTGKVVHLNGSKFWNFDSYPSWNEQDRLIKNNPGD